MNKNKFIFQLKQINQSPYVAIVFITGIHYLKELYSLSSSNNNWKNYVELMKVIKNCSAQNINPFISYLKLTEKSLFSKLNKDGLDFNVNLHKDLLHYHFSNRISSSIKEIKLKITKLKQFNNFYSWDDVFYYAKSLNIRFLPNKQDLNNKWIIDICKKYNFFEVKFDIWDNSLSQKKIEESFNNFCRSLSIKNNNLGNAEFSIYVGKFENEYNTSVYFSDGKYTILENLSAFAHEWAHYLDHRAYHDPVEIKLMITNNVFSGYHSDLITASMNIKSKNTKYNSLYNLLKKLLINESNLKPTKYYKICKNYKHAVKSTAYWTKMTEIFARLIEVYVSNLNNNNILTLPLDNYEKWQIYPKVNMLKPIYKDIHNFIKLSTDN